MFSTIFVTECLFNLSQEVSQIWFIWTIIIQIGKKMGFRNLQEKLENFINYVHFNFAWLTQKNNSYSNADLFQFQGVLYIQFVYLFVPTFDSRKIKYSGCVVFSNRIENQLATAESQRLKYVTNSEILPKGHEMC